MIEVKNLTKRYGAKIAVDDLSFSVKDGEILGFLGPNGAGKSTTMNMITGYVSSTEGTVTVGGDEILESPLKAKARIGYLPEQPPLYLDMTVEEYLSFLYDLKKVKGKKKERIGEICRLVDIEDVRGRLLRNLSKGYRQRAGLAQALLGRPQALILDEPTVGLDPRQIIDIRDLIKDLGKEHTIILSSHILPEVQAVCERVIVIDKGRILADDSPGNLSRSMSGEHKITLRAEGPQDGLLALLEGLPGMRRAALVGQREETAWEFSLEAEPGRDIRRELFRALAEKDWPILSLQGSEMSLEDIFLQLTGEEDAPPQEPEADPPAETPQAQDDSDGGDSQ